MENAAAKPLADLTEGQKLRALPPKFGDVNTWKPREYSERALLGEDAAFERFLTNGPARQAQRLENFYREVRAYTGSEEFAERAKASASWKVVPEAV